jgi:hypothetical protein
VLHSQAEKSRSRPPNDCGHLTENSIEERVWETLRLKKALFTGLFDKAKDEISFEKLRRKSMMHVIKEVFSDQPGRPKPVLASEAPQPVAVTEAKRNGKTAVKDDHAHGLPIGTRPQFPADRAMPLAQSAAQDDNGKSVSSIPDPSQGAAKFLEAGLTLLESLSSRSNADVARATDSFEPIKRGLSPLLRTDAQTQVPTLTIPLPESITAESPARR